MVFSILLTVPVGVQNTFALTTFDFKAIGDFSAPSIVEPDFTVTGSEPITITTSNGLGIGILGMETFYYLIDGNEFVTFTFNGVVSYLTYTVGTTGNQDQSQGQEGEAFIEAFDSNGMSLGTIPTGGTGIKDVSALFGGVPISKFTVTADADTHAIIAITYDLSQIHVIGGEMIPIESTSLLLASAQSFSWMLPVVLSILGIGLFFVRKIKI